MAYLRTGILAMLLASTGTIAAAAPIHLDKQGPQSSHFLTAEQWEILDQLSDHGWHLGWFKGAVSGLTLEDDALADLLAIVGVPGEVLTGGRHSGAMGPLGQVTQPLDARLDVSAQVTAVPEPASLLLLAGGLAGIAARARHRRKRLTE